MIGPILGFFVSFVLFYALTTKSNETINTVLEKKDADFKYWSDVTKQSEEKYSSLREDIIQKRYDEVRSCHDELKDCQNNRIGSVEKVKSTEQQIAKIKSAMQSEIDHHKADIGVLKSKLEMVEQENEVLKEKQKRPMIDKDFLLTCFTFGIIGTAIILASVILRSVFSK